MICDLREIPFPFPFPFHHQFVGGTRFLVDVVYSHVLVKCCMFVRGVKPLLKVTHNGYMKKNFVNYFFAAPLRKMFPAERKSRVVPLTKGPFIVNVVLSAYAGLFDTRLSMMFPPLCFLPTCDILHPISLLPSPFSCRVCVVFVACVSVWCRCGYRFLCGVVYVGICA